MTEPLGRFVLGVNQYRANPLYPVKQWQSCAARRRACRRQKHEKRLSFFKPCVAASQPEAAQSNPERSCSAATRGRRADQAVA